MKPTMLLAIVIVVFVGAIVVIDQLNRQPTQTPTTSISVEERGKLLYDARCAVCHGGNLQGQPNWQRARSDGSYPAPPHDATGHTWHHNDQYFIEVTLYGGATVTGIPTNAMPGFAGSLSETDVKAILAYIKTSWPDDIRATQAALNE
ncbi:MAG: c-type cytochrome [Roseiflexaceae bacterium]